MSVSEQEARESLAAVEDAMARCRRSLASAGAPYLIIWGAIWIAGFVAVQFWNQTGGWIFTGLDVIGILLSVAVGVAQGRRGPVRSAEERSLRRRLLVFGIAVFAFIWLSLAMMGTSDPLKCTAVACTTMMFAYVVMGLWLDALYLAWAGFAVAALTAVGFFLLPQWFMLWMAVFGGGTLLGVGSSPTRFRKPS